MVHSLWGPIKGVTGDGSLVSALDYWKHETTVRHISKTYLREP